MSADRPQRDLDQLWNESVEDSAGSSAASPPRTRGVIAQFFAENWLWIVVPALLVVVALLALAIYIENQGGNDDEPTPFTYTTY